MKNKQIQKKGQSEAFSTIIKWLVGIVFVIIIILLFISPEQLFGQVKESLFKQTGTIFTGLKKDVGEITYEEIPEDIKNSFNSLYELFEESKKGGEKKMFFYEPSNFRKTYRMDLYLESEFKKETYLTLNDLRKKPAVIILGPDKLPKITIKTEENSDSKAEEMPFKPCIIGPDGTAKNFWDYYTTGKIDEDKKLYKEYSSIIFLGNQKGIFSISTFDFNLNLEDINIFTCPDGKVILFKIDDTHLCFIASSKPNNLGCETFFNNRPNANFVDNNCFKDYLCSGKKPQLTQPIPPQPPAEYIIDDTYLPTQDEIIGGPKP